MLFEEIRPSILDFYERKRLPRDLFLLHHLRSGLIAGRENCGSNFERIPIDENRDTRRACVLLARGEERVWLVRVVVETAHLRGAGR